MVKGLEHFKDRFRGYSDNFILVGGVASYLLLDEAGAPKTRATKDLDIVLMIKPTNEFIRAIKDYVVEGGYEIQEGENGQSRFYRFQKPTDDEFPIMIELFATAGSDIKLFEGQHIIPISSSDGAESLSAILLDDEYFSIIKKNGVDNDGIYILNYLGLIPFKAKAYLEIKERGEDSRSWKKHRGDIINLAVNFLSTDQREELTGKVRDHFVEFMKQLEDELTTDIINGACKQNVPAQNVVDILKKTFL